MGSLGDYGETIALDAATGVFPADGRYVALYTDVLTAAGVGTEVANAAGYERKAVTFSAATTNTGVTSSSNSAEVLFNLATGTWGQIQSIGIWDSATYGLGNLIWYGELTTYKTIEANDQLRFATGDIDVTMD
jgi:hypothetical protein